MRKRDMGDTEERLRRAIYKERVRVCMRKREMGDTKERQRRAIYRERVCVFV